PLHLAAQLAVRTYPRASHPEALAAFGHDAEQAVGVVVEIHDARQRAHRGRQGRLAGLAPLQDQADAEAALVARALAHQVKVARLEDAQLQPPAGVQHGGQREQRQLGAGGTSSHAGSVTGSCCAPSTTVACTAWPTCTSPTTLRFPPAAGPSPPSPSWR